MWFLVFPLLFSSHTPGRIYFFFRTNENTGVEKNGFNHTLNLLFYLSSYEKQFHIIFLVVINYEDF